MAMGMESAVFSAMAEVSFLANAVPQNRMSIDDPRPVSTPDATSAARLQMGPVSARVAVPAQPRTLAPSRVLREM